MSDFLIFGSILCHDEECYDYYYCPTLAIGELSSNEGFFVNVCHVRDISTNTNKLGSWNIYSH